MGNKNSTQVVIPFDFKGKSVKEYARQSWNTTFGRQQNVGVMPKRIMSAVLSQIKKDDLNFAPYYRFHISDFALADQDISSLYKEVKEAFVKMADLKWFFEDLDKKNILNSKFAFRHLLNTTDANCGYDNGYLTISINPLLRPLFLELAHYTVYELKWYMTFTSWYSMRLFECLSAFKDTGVWEVSIDHYRGIMDCVGKLKETKDLINKTVSTPLLELERTDCAFTWEPIHDENRPLGSRGRKPIIGLRFKLKKVQLKEIPSNVDIPEHTQKIIDKLMKRYQVSEANIVKYLKAITTEEARKLLHSWDVKEASSDPIKNKLLYCNKVFVEVGKKAIENADLKNKK